MHWPAINHKRRKGRQDVSAFAALIATPASGAFSMPASGRIRFVSTAGAVAGTTAATLTGAYRPRSEDGETGEIVMGAIADRTIKTPELAAGQYIIIDRIEKGVEVTPGSGFDVEVDTGLGRWSKIAEGV